MSGVALGVFRLEHDLQTVFEASGLALVQVLCHILGCVQVYLVTRQFLGGAEVMV